MESKNKVTKERVEELGKLCGMTSKEACNALLLHAASLAAKMIDTKSESKPSFKDAALLANTVILYFWMIAAAEGNMEDFIYIKSIIDRFDEKMSSFDKVKRFLLDGESPEKEKNKKEVTELFKMLSTDKKLMTRYKEHLKRAQDLDADGFELTMSFATILAEFLPMMVKLNEHIKERENGPAH